MNKQNNSPMQLFGTLLGAVTKLTHTCAASPIKRFVKYTKQYTGQKQFARFDADIAKLGSQHSLLELADAIKKLKADWARLSKTINKGDVE